MRQSDIILIVKIINRGNPLSKNPVRFHSARISNCVEGEGEGFMSGWKKIQNRKNRDCMSPDAFQKETVWRMWKFHGVKISTH